MLTATYMPMQCISGAPLYAALWHAVPALCLQSVHPCSTLGSEEQLVLPGYGVEAVLKNMEYSAIDDKAKADAAAAAKKAAQKGKAGSAGNDDLSDIDVSSLGEVKGFKFDVLAQRKSHLVPELMTFRDVLMSNDEEEAIKVGLWFATPVSRFGPAAVSLHLQQVHAGMSVNTPPGALLFECCWISTCVAGYTCSIVPCVRARTASV
jgi:hypothetical protein